MLLRKAAPMTENTDPRPSYARALSWAHGLIAAVTPEQLDDPTPCDEFDVRALIGHLVATVDRAEAIGRGLPPLTVAPVVTGVPDDGWAAAFAAATDRALAVWRDDALLDAVVGVPWGEVPGRAAVWGYLNEALVHGWDLAVATGQDPEADPDLAEAVLPAVTPAIPAEMRGGPVPFGPVVEPAPGAGPTERLANWSGRRAPQSAVR